MKENNFLSNEYEFCPRCEANLTLQKGYRNDLPYWTCRGCGEMLINPDVPAADDVAWICDGCGEMLNTQDRFTVESGVWTCTKCGFENKVDESQIFLSDEEYLAELDNPYRGLSDEAILEISGYVEIRPLREDIFIVEDPESGKRFVKKYLRRYDLSVYRCLAEHPIRHMPKIIALYESENCLILIEELIAGKTVHELLEAGPLGAAEAIRIARDLAVILQDLHGGQREGGMKEGGMKIIHRDVKPSNVILNEKGEVFLLDIDAAKQYTPEKSEDTKLIGTLYYAAPEQFGYGLSSSDEKADIYALGIMLNVMATGKFPKEQRADAPLWDIVEKCIRLEPAERYSDRELLDALDITEVP